MPKKVTSSSSGARSNRYLAQPLVFVCLSSMVVWISFLCLRWKGIKVLHGQDYWSSLAPTTSARGSREVSTSMGDTISLLKNAHFLLVGLNLSSVTLLLRDLMSNIARGSRDIYPLVYVCYINIIFFVSNIDTVQVSRQL